eukprot:scaffold25898_cov63-Phaeocystis_antarctica.AAC.2
MDLLILSCRITLHCCMRELAPANSSQGPLGCARLCKNSGVLYAQLGTEGRALLFVVCCGRLTESAGVHISLSHGVRGSVRDACLRLSAAGAQHVPRYIKSAMNRRARAMLLLKTASA